MIVRNALVLALGLVAPFAARCRAQVAGSAAPPRLVVPDPGGRIDAPVSVLVWRLTQGAGTSAVRVWADSVELSANAVEAGGKLVVVLPDSGRLTVGRHRVAAEACSPVRCDFSETDLEVGAGGAAGRPGTGRLELLLHVLEGAALWLLART